MTSPLLRGRVALEDAEPEVTSEAIEALYRLARSRGAQRIAVGRSRDQAAIAVGQSLGERWVDAGGVLALELTWPETAASWLRQATRFAAADADLWIMFGRPLGWAQMTRRLLWSTPWSPAKTLLAGAVADRAALDLVGLHNVHGIAGATRSGDSWHLTVDDRIVTTTRTRS